MKKVVVLSVLLVVMVVGPMLQGGSDSMDNQEAIKQAVLKVHDVMMRASNNLDVDGFFAHILDSNTGLIIQNGVLFQTRQEAYEAVEQGFRGLSKLERAFDRTYVTVVSPQCAVITGSGKAAATLDDGRVLSSPFSASMIFVLKDGQWKLLQGHYSSPNRQ